MLQAILGPECQIYAIITKTQISTSVDWIYGKRSRLLVLLFLEKIPLSLLFVYFELYKTLSLIEGAGTVNCEHFFVVASTSFCYWTWSLAGGLPSQRCLAAPGSHRRNPTRCRNPAGGKARDAPTDDKTAPSRPAPSTTKATHPLDPEISAFPQTGNFAQNNSNSLPHCCLAKFCFP